MEASTQISKEGLKSQAICNRVWISLQEATAIHESVRMKLKLQ
jgi:hypothetical protein